MPLPKLKSARYVYVDNDGDELPRTSLNGRPFLVLAFEDGREAFIDTEQKLLHIGVNAVHVGLEEFNDVELVKTHPQNGSELRLKGFTDDGQVVNLTQNFLIALEKRIFKPGPVALLE